MINRIDQNNRMSQASQNGNLIVLSGQVSSGKNITEQAQGVFETIDLLLHKAGADKSNILYANIFLTDMGDYEAFNQVWDNWVASDKGQAPSRAAIQVVRLANPDWVVEVQVFASI
ncbi:RidA family protein [Pseudomonas segetis]|uniref:Enamine deaminase RidA, house cleaning of reactive enamine intermediates, YjgF/YER057c/UK114 family n=1 Tax=Pseudomonas segetis TaxID=298908 RepID=A0A239IZ84_9PSED|nr:RidA family protein [Pseudomonas segetis]SNS98518.1 Enamine deaminase RidA, house cleaning of reactive enamine intermediates, YjgF/YER057c/UK114 family [Pseudomonas segetis]